MRTRFLLTLLAAFVTIACGSRNDFPAEINFQAPSLYPEGIDFDPLRREFVVSSMRLGTVGRVTREGEYRVLYRDQRLKSTVGVRVDAPRDRVLICYTDHGRALRTSPDTRYKTAGLLILRLSNGSLIRNVNLAAVPRPRAGPLGSASNRRFSNDVAVDPKTGIAYVTDSFAPVIYRVLPNGDASILVEHALLAGKGVNANGILFRGTYLLVSKFNTGLLLKIPLVAPSGGSAAPRMVRLPRTFPNADGLASGPGDSVILIANGKTNQVVQLVSDDDWVSARVKKTHATGPVFATTGVMIGGRVYVAHAMLHKIARDREEPVKRFTIRGYPFP